MRWPDRRTNVGKWREPKHENTLFAWQAGVSGLVGPKRPRLRLTLSELGLFSIAARNFILTFRHLRTEPSTQPGILAFFTSMTPSITIGDIE